MNRDKIESTIKKVTNQSLESNSIDLSKTKREDEIQWVQNDAKFSAVRQGFEQEQFRQLVAGAHLKGTKPGEIAEITQTKEDSKKGQQKKISVNKDEEKARVISNLNLDINEEIKNKNQFKRKIDKIKDNDIRVHFILSFEESKLYSFIDPMFDTEQFQVIISHIIEQQNTHGQDNDINESYIRLLKFTHNKQGIIQMKKFLSKKEKAALVSHLHFIFEQSQDLEIQHLIKTLE